MYGANTLCVLSMFLFWMQVDAGGSRIAWYFTEDMSKLTRIILKTKVYLGLPLYLH